MTSNESQQTIEAIETPKVKFPREFWVANFMELLERAAFYGFYIVITLYLTDLVGFSDSTTGIVAGIFMGTLFFLTPFSGAIADRMGFKNSLIFAFGLLTIGYTSLALLPFKSVVLFFLLFIAVGGSFIKPLVSGTVAKTTTTENRARGFALFYWVVNIGAFSGKTFAPYIRLGVGVQYINLFSGAMALIALLFAIFIFKQNDKPEDKKSIKEVARNLLKVLTNLRLLTFILIVSGFWIIAYQLYSTLPKYVIRLVGVDAKPEWIANVNPLVVVIFVVLITKWMKKYKATTSIFIGMLLVSVAAFILSLSQSMGNSISVFNLFTTHPLTLMLIIAIAIQGLAECFISPRYLEYFSLQAPKGEEGTYLGFANLYSFFGVIASFTISGFLLEAYCPDPNTLPIGLSAAEKAVYYQDAHKIWYVFIAIGLIAALAFKLFTYFTNRIDAAKEVAK